MSLSEEQEARLADIECRLQNVQPDEARSIIDAAWLLALVKELDEDRAHVQQAGINAEAGRARAEQQLAAVTAELQRMREKYEAHG